MSSTQMWIWEKGKFLLRCYARPAFCDHTKACVEFTVLFFKNGSLLTVDFVG